MKKKNNHITVFEHQALKLGHHYNDVCFDETHLKACQKFYGTNGVPYFSLIHNGICFKEYVGVIQVGDLVIEILPKADALFSATDEKTQWRSVLIDMLFAVGVFDIHAPSSSSLHLKHNSILDLYFELFLKEVEYLLHNGLLKKYRKKEANVTALKGSLQFSKQIQYNLTHQERFYVRHTTYDVMHLLHAILYKTIRLLKKLNTNTHLQGRIAALLLHFPEMPDIKVTEATFDKLVWNRKNQSYQKAIDIAKLLLLQYHPDVSQGKTDVLALMFDMNLLWEQFVYVSLRKYKPADTTITAQSSKFFWKPDNGYRSSIRPDIVINKDHPEKCIVLDTKWKNLKGYNPSPDDLRQMYVYHEYYGASKVALVYPGLDSLPVRGNYISPKNSELAQNKECSIISIAVNPDIRKWQQEIFNKFKNWQE